MEFKLFKENLQRNFYQKASEVKNVFTANIDKDKIFEIYLDSFPQGTNEIFRERREYDCTCCKQFIRNIGGAVFIKDGNLTTIWDIDAGSETFNAVAKALDSYVKSCTIHSIYLNDVKDVVKDFNTEVLAEGSILWSHLFLALPNNCLNGTSESIEALQGQYKTSYQTFKRSLTELAPAALNTVLDLIATDSLHRGEEWETQLKQFKAIQERFMELSDDFAKDLFCWENVANVDAVMANLKGKSIGELISDISLGVPLEKAITSYEKMVGGENYKRKKPIYTQADADKAEATVKELELEASLGRRFGQLDDITANNILFANRDISKKLGVSSSASVFADIKAALPVDSKKLKSAEEVDARRFITDILPKAKELEVLVENKHVNDFVSLTAPSEKTAKTLFAWDNAFGWAYTGNMTDSAMKSRVKSAGGNVEGVLRFSTQWNELEADFNDIDTHCVEPGGYEIYFRNKTIKSPTGGVLDVDIVNPSKGIPAVESIAWATEDLLKNGTYSFFAKCYSNNGGRSGFRAEVEVNNVIHSFAYDRSMRTGEIVKVAEVVYKDGEFTVVEKLSSSVSSREVWGVKTGQFVPVTVAMYSPNYWDEQDGKGQRHLFFMLDGCVSDERPNGFFNEYLRSELRPHARVFEVLGSRMRVEETQNQLSGLGFSLTKRNEVVVKVTSSDSQDKVYRVKF